MAPRKRARNDSNAPEISRPLEIKATMEADSFREELVSMWREGRLCDVTIVVEGRSFPAHRLVLSAESPLYMKPMLSTSFAESKEQTITLKEVSSSLFEAALTFMYTRRCTLASELELQPLLQTACMLQVPALQAAAEQAMVDKLIPATCAAAIDLASHLPLAHLMASAQKLALAAFVDVSGSDTFHLLPLARLETLLAHDELCAKEEQVFDGLQKWLGKQPAPPSAEEEARLLQHVRFPLMKGRDYVLEQVEKSPLVARHSLIYAQSLRESRFKEDTPRTRRRRAGLLPYASLEEGLLVCVDTDREFVEGECERAVEGATDPCVWDDDGEMAKCVGTRGKISELDASLQGAKIEFDAVDDEWWFPFTVLSRAVEAGGAPS